MQTIINILVFFVILGAIVLIHELGHFLTAKLFGVYCAEFSIGMGPKLFSKKKEKQMASSKEFLEYILEQLSEVEEITYRAMMGEYIIYYKGRIAGGIYDDRLLINPVKSVIDYVSDIRYEVPYEGAKEMILIEEVDNKEYLTELFKAIYDDLPTPKKKK